MTSWIQREASRMWGLKLRFKIIHALTSGKTRRVSSSLNTNFPSYLTLTVMCPRQVTLLIKGSRHHSWWFLIISKSQSPNDWKVRITSSLEARWTPPSYTRKSPRFCSWLFTLLLSTTPAWPCKACHHILHQAGYVWDWYAADPICLVSNGMCAIIPTTLRWESFPHQ